MLWLSSDMCYPLWYAFVSDCVVALIAKAVIVGKIGDCEVNNTLTTRGSQPQAGVILTVTSFKPQICRQRRLLYFGSQSQASLTNDTLFDIA